MTTNKPITEHLKAKLDQLDLDKLADQAVEQAQLLFAQFREKAGEIAHERGDQIETLIDKVAVTVDQRTDRRYHEHVGRVREQASTAVARLAEQRRTEN